MRGACDINHNYISTFTTFLLLISTDLKVYVLLTLCRRVLQHGVPYIGSSAGSAVSINTTNDMPIGLSWQCHF